MAILDTYSNITAAWSMDRYLLTSYGAGAKYTTATGVSSLNDQSGNARHATQATGANQPTVGTAGPQSRACALFDGTNDVLATAGAISTLITNSAGYIVCAVLIEAVTTNNTGFVYQNDSIFSDNGGYIAIHLTTTGYTYAYNFDTSADVAGIRNGIPINGPVAILEWKHESGNISLRINGGYWIDTASGNTGVMTNVFRIGASYTTGNIFTDMSLFEMICFDAVPSGAQQDALVADMIAHYTGLEFLNKVVVAAAYQQTSPPFDAVTVNKFVVAAAYQQANSSFDSVIVNKFVAATAYQKLPFYLSGDEIRVSQVVGFDLSSPIPITIHSTDSNAAVKDETINIYVLVAGAPALHSQTASRTSVSATTSSISVTTNVGNGTIYWVATTSETQPTGAQIVAGQNHLGAAATDTGTIAVSSTGVKVDTATGLTSGIDYYIHFYHVGADAKFSNVVTAEALSPDVIVPAPFMGAMLRSYGTTAQNYSSATTISWSDVVYDFNGFFDLSAPTQLTVPAECNGEYGIVSVQVCLSSVTDADEVRIEIFKNGSIDYAGVGTRAAEIGVGAEAGTEGWIQCSTAPIPLTTGDIFIVKVTSVDTSVNLVAGRSAFSIRIVPTANGALVKKAADQTAANYSTFVAVGWDTEVHDVDGAFTVGSPTLFTIPAAWNGKYGILRGNTRITSLTSSSLVGLYFYDNSGGSTWDGVGTNFPFGGAFTTMDVSVRSQPVLLETGDTYNLTMYSSDTSITVEAEYTWFGIEVLDTIQGVLVKKSADQTAANYSTPTALVWQTEIYDTHGSHSGSDSKLIIPAALDGKYIVLMCNVTSESMSAFASGSISITKNGSKEYDGFAGAVVENGNTSGLFVQCQTQPIRVSEGDEFEAVFYSSDTSVTIASGRSSFGFYVVNVTEGNSAPTDIALSASTVAENAPEGTVIGVLSATDPDGNDITFSLPDSAGGRFAISGTNLVLADTLDYEAATSHNITVRASDGEKIYDEVFAITVTAVTETIFGVLVYPTANVTGQDYSTGSNYVAFGSEQYDTVAGHSGASNTKITIPASLNGYYGVLSARLCITSVTDNTSAYLGLTLGGANAFDGHNFNAVHVGANAEGGSEAWLSATSQLIPLTTGQEYEVHIRATDTSVDIESTRSSFSLLAYPTIKGCLMKKAADQTGVNLSTSPVVGWDTDIFDPDAAHDTGSNTSRITIPAAWNGKYGVFRGNFYLTSVGAGSNAAVFMKKGGTAITGNWQTNNGSFTFVAMGAESQPVLLATGEYYEVAAYCSDTSVTIEQENSTFGVQVFDTIEGCLCVKSVDQTAANYSSPTAVAWPGADLYDTNTLHDPSSNNTKIIVTSALNGKYAILRANIAGSLVTASSTASLKITKNGSGDYVGRGGASLLTAVTLTSVYIQCATQPILLATGDEFECVFYCSDTSITVNAALSSFGLQVVSS